MNTWNCCEPPLREWIQELRQAQDHLGELPDLQILISGVLESEKPRQRSNMPVLRAEINGQQQQLHGLRWRDLAQRLHRNSQRHTIQRHLLELGQRSALSS